MRSAFETTLTQFRRACDSSWDLLTEVRADLESIPPPESGERAVHSTWTDQDLRLLASSQPFTKEKG